MAKQTQTQEQHMITLRFSAGKRTLKFGRLDYDLNDASKLMLKTLRNAVVKRMFPNGGKK